MTINITNRKGNKLQLNNNQLSTPGEISEMLNEMEQDARNEITWGDVIEYAIVRDLKVTMSPLPKVNECLVSVYRPVNVWTDPEGSDELVLEFHNPLYSPVEAIDRFVQHLSEYKIRDLDTGLSYK